jgi:Arc/MetJ-type ribon-helix-helix transcriptional regulator
MELRITPTPDQEAFIRDGIASGRFESAEAIARLALGHWEEYERRRAVLIAELNEADESIDRGEGIYLDSDEAVDAFFDDVRREARVLYESSRPAHEGILRESQPSA